MVQLPPSPTVGVTLAGDQSEEKERMEGPLIVLSPNGESTASPGAPPSFDFPTAYYGYETYIEDGLICLKHKVRNLEKKKLKLEHYKRSLTWGEKLNKDQMAATDKYEQVVHNLEFAKELHKTLDNLTQNLAQGAAILSLLSTEDDIEVSQGSDNDQSWLGFRKQLLRSQKKAAKREQVVRVEAERRRLSMVLQVQHLLSSIQQAQVKKDLQSGRNQAPYIPARHLNSLSQLASLLGVRQDDKFSLEQWMEQAAVIYVDLLEGEEKPVAGSTFKLLKEELTKLLKCKYFSCLPSKTTTLVQSKETQKEVSKENYKDDFMAMREDEPPDSWDLEFSDEGVSTRAAVNKPWKGAATFIAKAPVTSKSTGSKQEKERKAKKERNAKTATRKDLPVMNFSSPTFPKDPIIRKKHLEDLMTKICGSFSFMQDSLLDCESSSTELGNSRFKKEPSELSSPPALKNSSDPLPKEMHSTPLPARLLEHKTRLTNGDQGLKSYELEMSSNEPLHLAEPKTFSSPLFSTPESAISSLLPESGTISPCNTTAPIISIPAHKHAFSTPPARQTVTSVQFPEIPAVLNGDAKVEPKYANSSTQTPPEFAPSEDDLQTIGGTCILQTHQKNYGPLFGAPKDSGSQFICGCGVQHHVSAAWRDSSQLSSPDRAEEFATVDSGHGDSLPVSMLEVPHSPQGHHTSLLPMQLYPFSQPLKVAFTASRTVNFAPGHLDQPIVFDQLHSNLGEMFDTHVGRFTCPVNGMYVFMFHILKLAINVPLYINLMCNGEVMVSAYANDGAPDHETASNHAILPLFQGDQVWLRLHRGAIYGSTWKYSTFSGFLLYQD